MSTKKHQIFFFRNIFKSNAKENLDKNTHFMNEILYENITLMNSHRLDFIIFHNLKNEIN